MKRTMPHIGTPQPAYSVGPPSARQRNAIQKAFRWRADSGPHLNVYWDMRKCLNKHTCAVIQVQDTQLV